MADRHMIPDPGALREVVASPDKTVYTFTLDSFKITDTRSVHNDTDFVSVAVAVGQNPPITAPTKSMGDVNNGTHAVNLSIPNVAVGPDDVVAFSYSIVNTGHDKDSVEQALQKVTAAAASKGASAGAAAIGGAVGGPLGSLITFVGSQAFGWVAGELEGILFADCDGPVAAGDHVYTGAQLAQQTSGGKTISATDDNKGSTSHVGCGSNSRYYVTWAISAHAVSSVAVGGGSRSLTGQPPHRER